MKRLLKILCVSLLLVCFTIPMFGCKSNLTMQEIRSAAWKNSSATVNGERYYLRQINGANQSDFETLFERNNIDSEEFLAMDRYGYYDGNSKHIYVYVFKFDDRSEARKCCKKFDSFAMSDNTNSTKTYGEDYTAKRYGKLVVVADKKLADYFFGIMDNL